jgi:hypothetical protein
MELAQMFVSLLDSMTLSLTLREGRQFDYETHAKAMIQVFLNGARTAEPKIA